MSIYYHNHALSRKQNHTASLKHYPRPPSVPSSATNNPLPIPAKAQRGGECRAGCGRSDRSVPSPGHGRSRPRPRSTIRLFSPPPSPPPQPRRHLRHQHHQPCPRKRHREHHDERRARDPSNPRKTAPTPEERHQRANRRGGMIRIGETKGEPGDVTDEELHILPKNIQILPLSKLNQTANLKTNRLRHPAAHNSPQKSCRKPNTQQLNNHSCIRVLSYYRR